MAEPNYNEEQQAEIDRIVKHIKALYVSYNNMIELLERELKDVDVDEDKDAKEKIKELQVKTYAQGIGELADVADKLFEKITLKKAEKQTLIDSFTEKKDVNNSDNNNETNSKPKKSKLSQQLK